MRKVFPVKQGVVAPIEITLKDRTGTVLALASVSAITLACWNGEGIETTDAVNNRKIGHANSNLLNANGGTLHATSGLFTWLLAVEDTVIVNPRLGIGDTELHVFRLEVVHTQSGSPYPLVYGLRVERTK